MRIGATLHYQAAGGTARRNRLRSSILLTVALVCVFWSIRFGPSIWRRGEIAFWADRCKRYVYPPGYEIAIARPTGAAGTPLIKLHDLLQDNRTLPSFDDCTVGFLHERKSIGGRSRLIIVYVHNDRLQFGQAQFRCLLIRGGTLAEALENPIRGSARGKTLSFPFAPLQLYAGQVDPNDPSSFTFRYISSRESGTIKVQLRDATNTDAKSLNDDVYLDFSKLADSESERAGKGK